jgi:hypothetical protein
MPNKKLQKKKIKRMHWLSELRRRERTYASEFGPTLRQERRTLLATTAKKLPKHWRHRYVVN